MSRIFRNQLVLYVLLLLAACGGGGGGSGAAALIPPVQFTYAPPVDNGDGWAVASLADEGMNEALITTMMQRILEGTYPGIDAVAIARNDKLVLHEQIRLTTGRFDRWANNSDPERHILHSTSKSVTSALIGIAIDQGHIASTQVPFYDLFNYGAYDNWDARKGDMTLEDALTMRLGLEWDEWSLPYTDPQNDLVFLENNNNDWAKALLDLPMTSDPGTVFTYNTAATIAIGQALENVAGIPMADYANQYLFYPLDIFDAVWAMSPTGLPIGGSGLYLKIRDQLKFGQLFVNDGVWNGQQLISAAWVADSVVRRVDISSWATYSEAYGFQWWLDDFVHQQQTVDAWVTAGYGGQYIFCIPELDLVVAFSGHNYENGVGVSRLYEMVEDLIIAAVN
ncbi:MAG: serine hydrolase [Woeseiaceae bacterium]|nr:serine hydrolase [Woeseiaceae bacterium]